MTKTPVAHLTSVHPPFDVRIFEKECRSLAATGRQITLVCCHDRDTVVGGVRVLGLSAARGGRIIRMFRMTARIYRAAGRSGAGTFHFHDPELILVGLMLKSRGARVIYDVHEDVPLQIAEKTWISRSFRKPAAAVARAAETLAGRIFDGVVAATPAIAIKFPPAKTVIVQNYPIAGELDQAVRSNYTDRARIVVYIGSLSVERGVEVMAEVARGLARSGEGALHVAGPIAEPSLRQVLLDGQSNEGLTYHGVLDRSGVRQMLASARVGLVTLQPSPRFLDAYPVKMFEYWSAGIPVIASDFPLWREIVGEVGGGLLVDPTDPSAVLRAILWIFEHPAEAEAMGRRGQQAILDRLNWQAEAEKLVALYDRIEGGA